MEFKKRIRTYSGTKGSAPSKREQANRQVARKAAAEGMVLLMNEGVLPLKADAKVALFGGGAVSTIKGGTGSGDVNEREVVGIYQGFLDAGIALTNQSWLEDYAKIYRQAREDWRQGILDEVAKDKEKKVFQVYSTHIFRMPAGSAMEAAQVEAADVVFYVISRTAGEDADRFLQPGDYYLTDAEKADLDFLNSHSENLVVILNTGGAMDLQDILGLSHLKALFSIVQPGMEGGHALADVLTSKVTPSGKLTDTWAKAYSDIPNSENYSHNNGNVQKEYYTEGIYVGYRYFDSFERNVAFPFGFGLSYTDFAIETMGLSVGDGQGGAQAQDGGGDVRASEVQDDARVSESRRDAQVSGGAQVSGSAQTLDGVPAPGGEQSGDWAMPCVTVKVTNIGTVYSGREVVQVYVSCPQTGLAKERRRRCGFGKTKVLAPGESETLRISIPVKNLASFSEEQSAWIVEKGQYGIWVGNCSVSKEEGRFLEEGHFLEKGSSLEISGILEVAEDAVIETVKHILPLQEELTELACPEEIRLAQERAWKAAALSKGLQPVSFVPVREAVKSYEEHEAAKAARELAAKLSEEQMIAMVIGEISKGQGQALGSAGIMVPGAAGETSSCLEEEYGVPGVPMADGPAGIRLMKSYEVDRATGGINNQGIFGAVEGGIFADHTKHENTDTYYQYATAIPVGTLLAQTWDTALLEEVGQAVAVEMEEFGIGWWLAPGMNIHRNPLCGRNFEYFSEDPLVTGQMAAAITRGVQSRNGVGTTIKHFACNNQEDNRMGCDSIVSERALREIYLRGFEIAVKTSQPMAIMTSYNLINGVHAANSKDMCTVAAREEWNFQGIIMTDWTTTQPRGGSSSWGCIAAGNDLIMPGYAGDVEDIRAALADGRFGTEELRACVERMLTVIFQTNAYQDSMPYGARFK
nr:glycoside hydrolase family 3 protein [uncultured Acetatifactor sp.]